ncbi:epoxide hydrolase family protein [Pseudonocardia sp. TRM90224]|uniref:epoxide hydrolase family protein n=1 Tax=Pseudonocardia sp. TRM90224 TaxID=2812678 RepID=UPI001E54C668|nr:epoxide hydrolase family protein [Pseudonocardia sp. TRM90224]
MENITPFTIEIGDEELADLRDRLARTRWTDELPPSELEGVPVSGPVAPGWQYGVPRAYVEKLVGRWLESYDWRAHEARLNSYPQFTTTIDGQNVHFVHIPSENPNAVPLILTHGWPNTFVEYLGLVESLTADFHLVIPSIPGHGFSGPTRERGWDAARVARAWAELMRRLGYFSYGVHGNDAGAIIGPLLGRIDAAHVLGVHVNQIFSFPSGDPAEFAGLSQDDMAYLGFLQSFVDYAIHDKAQKAQPQTLSHALADSPAGQLAWIGQLLGEALDPDDVLTIASIYWFTNTAASSARFYYENDQSSEQLEPTTFPIGLASFVNDFRPIRVFVERDHKNVVAWNEYDRGGHWAAHDAPDLLAEDIRAFFTSLNDKKGS